MQGRLKPLPPMPTNVPDLGGFHLISKPEKLPKNATEFEKRQYKEDLFRWKQALRKSTWWFEKKEFERTKRQLASVKNGQVRRAREKEAFVEIIDPMVVFNRDNWICKLCNHPVSKLRDKRFIDIASLDHIIPLAKGGKHSYDNVQLAHLSCNLRKGARV